MTELIKLENISFMRDGKDILQGINLIIESNNTLTIVGQNGAGKSSLISLILGLNQATSGTITRKKNLRLSFIPQKFTILPDLPMNVKRFLADLPNTKKMEYLEMMGIEHLINSQLQSLSGGETQRLLLVRAMLREPELLVLDEPAAGIDQAAIGNYYHTISQFHKEHGAAVLMVSHDLHFVMKSSNHVICLNKVICCQGKPEEISQHTDFTKLLGKEISLYQHNHL